MLLLLLLLCRQVSCYPESGCLFPALKAAGVTAVYSGHDHLNNFYAVHEGIRLGYGAKTGYGSYGPAVRSQHGARVLVLRAGQSAADGDTWLRFEDGSKSVQTPTWGKTLWQMLWPFRQHVCN
jgi:pre-mRNA-splicing factor SYF1